MCCVWLRVHKCGVHVHHVCLYVCMWMQGMQEFASVHLFGRVGRHGYAYRNAYVFHSTNFWSLNALSSKRLLAQICHILHALAVISLQVCFVENRNKSPGVSQFVLWKTETRVLVLVSLSCEKTETRVLVLVSLSCEKTETRVLVLVSLSCEKTETRVLVLVSLSCEKQKQESWC